MSDFGGMDTVFPHPTDYPSETPAQGGTAADVIDATGFGLPPASLLSHAGGACVQWRKFANHQKNSGLNDRMK